MRRSGTYEMHYWLSLLRLCITNVRYVWRISRLIIERYTIIRSASIRIMSMIEHIPPASTTYMSEVCTVWIELHFIHTRHGSKLISIREKIDFFTKISPDGYNYKHRRYVAKIQNSSALIFPVLKRKILRHRILLLLHSDGDGWQNSIWFCFGFSGTLLLVVRYEGQVMT